MDNALARDYLARGLAEIQAKQTVWDRRQDYFEGRQDAPFAPEGVNDEYVAIQDMSIANWLALAMTTPVQRLRVDRITTGRGSDVDAKVWNEIWQPNKLDSRQRIPYTQMVVHGRGLMSCWPNQANKKTPTIRPENGRRVHLEPDPEDPFTTKWSVKLIKVKELSASSGTLWLPTGVEAVRHIAWVYDDDTWAKFEKGGGLGGDWVITGGGKNPLGEVPFVPYENRQDADAKPHSALEPLMPAQDAINTIRFNTLLAMQFSAYRQRVFTGYDPVLRDSRGQPIFKKNSDDSLLLDAQGQPMPAVRSPGRIGVDRALVFPGENTRVFDLDESNLDNYIKVLGEFLSDFFAVGQIPPQYLLNRMANLSGDALEGAESTLEALVGDLKLWAGESNEHLMRLAVKAAGHDAPDQASEVAWADTKARSFSQMADSIQKLVTAGLPKNAGLEMIPGATAQQVTRWIGMRAAEQGAGIPPEPLEAPPGIEPGTPQDTPIPG